MVPPAGCKSAFADNLPEKTCLKDVEQEIPPEKEQGTRKAVLLQLMWSRLIVYIICIFCVTAFVLANAAWAFYTYFPRNCDRDIANSYQSARVFPTSQSEIWSSDEEILSEERPTRGVAGNASPFFVDRDAWGAEPPAEPLTRLKLPVPYVIISHTLTDFCQQQSECTFRTRIIQTFHINSRGWSDIAYSFLVGGDGNIYVGRGWDFVGAHTFGFNNKSIGITFIGTFNVVTPPKAQLDAAQKLIELGIKNGKIAPDYKLLGQRQVSTTLSPGDALYNVIKKWPHWSFEP